MIVSRTEDVAIDRAGLEEILKLHVEKAHSIDRASTKVAFDVQSAPDGYGMSERTLTSLRGSTIETTTPTEEADVLKVLGRRTFKLDEAETRAVVERYVAQARGVDVVDVVAKLKLEASYKCGRMGWMPAKLTGAVATIEIK